jgi:hypothetical protein
MGSIFSCKRREEMKESLLSSKAESTLWEHWPKKPEKRGSITHEPKTDLVFDSGLRIQIPRTPDIMCQTAGCDDINCSGQCESMAPRA